MFPVTPAAGQAAREPAAFQPLPARGGGPRSAFVRLCVSEKRFVTSGLMGCWLLNLWSVMALAFSLAVMQLCSYAAMYRPLTLNTNSGKWIACL
jgi:hypothetical protein